MPTQSSTSLSSWFLLESAAPSQLVTGTYHFWLVLLSVAVAIAASCAALQMAGHARESSTGSNRHVALAAGSAALGAGVWAMHFIGMLAFELCTTVQYSPGITLVSMIPSLAASWVALNLLARKHIGGRQLVMGGVLVGAGIGAMHYGGMLAMRMSAQLRFDPIWFIASIEIAVMLSMLALWIRFALVQSGRLGHAASIALAGTVMGLAIAGMHYAGMKAARFVGENDAALRPGLQDQSVLALTIALVALAIGATAIGGNALLRYYQLYQRLSESETRTRAIVSSAVDGIIAIDRRGVILSFNASAERIFGWLASEVIGQNIRRLVTLAHGAGLGIGMASLIGSGREVSGKRRDGTALALRLAVSTAELRGEPLYFGIVTDISERKAIEEELRNRETQYRTLIGNIPGVAFRSAVEPQPQLIFASEAIETMTGWPAAEFISGQRRLSDLMHPDDCCTTAVDASIALAEDRSYAIEYRILRRDGAERWISETASGVRDATGRLQWIDGVMLDVTEARLRNAEFETVATVLDRAHAVMHIDNHGIILSANDNLLAMTGHARDELVGQHHTCLYPTGQANGAEYAAHTASLRRGEILSGEFLRLGKAGRPGGREIWMQATYNPVFDQTGRVESFMMFATDTTQRKVMERELLEAKARAEQAATARSSFLANMSHEIRTPMNAILGFTDVLLNTTLAPAQRRHLDTVRHAAHSLLGLLNDILDTAKLEKGAVELEMADFSLRSLCEQVTASMRLGAEKKGLAFDLDYPAELPDYFRGDALRIQQVLVNLVGNAIKFTAEGSVAVQVRQQASSTVIAVIDTGIGIPADRVERIFDAFAQADATITRQFGGTGLGTTIARQLTELMGGRIVVTSEPGAGSRFEIRIPLAFGQAPEPSDGAPHPHLAPLSILVADDVPQNVELLELVLRGDGHTVHAACNGVEALQLFAGGSFDVILMDMHMPEMDGLSATRALREIEHRECRVATPVIALTASVQAADRHAALHAGMNGFATKPVVVAQLYAEIARVLDLQIEAVVPDTPDAVALTDEVIDSKRGLKLWRTPERLHGAIGAFLESQADTPGTLQNAMMLGDHETLTSLAHKISGTSGNLALPRLCTAAQALELAARSSADNAEAQDVLTGVQAVIDELQAVAARLPHASPSSADTASCTVADPTDRVDPEVLQAMFKRLRASLMDSTFDEATLQDVTDALPAVRVAGLVEAIDQFDFQGAVRHIDALQHAVTHDITTI